MTPLTISKLITPDGQEIIFLAGTEIHCWRKDPNDTEYQPFPYQGFQVETFPEETTVEAVRI